MNSKQRLKSLENACLNYRGSVRGLGEALLTMEQAGDPVDLYIRSVCVKKYSITQATAKVALRWVRGDFGDDEQAQALMAKVPLSILESMTPATIAEVLTNQHRIASSDEGRIVVKRYADMSVPEVRQNISVQGFKPIPDDVRKCPEFRSCKATGVMRDKGGLVFVAKLRGETVHMHVSPSLIDEAQALPVGEEAA